MQEPLVRKSTKAVRHQRELEAEAHEPDLHLTLCSTLSAGRRASVPHVTSVTMFVDTAVRRVSKLESPSHKNEPPVAMSEPKRPRYAPSTL